MEWSDRLIHHYLMQEFLVVEPHLVLDIDECVGRQLGVLTDPWPHLVQPGVRKHLRHQATLTRLCCCQLINYKC